MTVGKKIKMLRQQMRLTQKELGFYVGLNNVRVRHYETDVRTPKDSQLQVFAEYFGVPIEFFRDHILDTDVDAMHALFDLKRQYGGHVIKTFDETSHTNKYSLVFDNPTLNARMETWYNKENNIGTEFQKHPEYSVEEWEQRYPNSNLHKPSKQ